MLVLFPSFPPRQLCHTHALSQARDDKGAAAAMKEELKEVPPLAMMASEIKDEVYDDEDDTLDAGGCNRVCV